MSTVSSVRGSRLQCFDGDGEKYQVWEKDFLRHLLLWGLKSTILHGPEPAEEEDENEMPGKEKNAWAYAELVQCLDDKSLSLVMRKADDDGYKALKILRDYYNGEDTERRRGATAGDNATQVQRPAVKWASTDDRRGAARSFGPVCYRCGVRGHMLRMCDR